MVETNLKIITELKLVLEQISNNDELKTLFTSNPNDFSRDRKLTIDKIVAIIINMPKRSLSIELNDFFNLLKSKPVTKAAFCLQRGKLLPLIFQVLNIWLINSFYQNYDTKIKRWKNFRLIAIDGSTVNLVNREDVVSYFGTQNNQHSQAPMARIMQAYDVLNDMTVFSNIYPIKTSEKEIITNNIHHLTSDSINIFDRGFPSYELMFLMNNEEKKKYFVIRCKLDFNNEVKKFMLSKKKDKIVEFKPTPYAIASLYKKGFKIKYSTSIKVRMVKVILTSGITEVLLTNLYDSVLYSVEDLKCLYGLRWGIETSYGTQKNQLQIEQFSGHRVICIQQDFYASTFVTNLQSLINKQCDGYIFKINLNRKHVYKINRNISWGALKNNIVKLFLENTPLEILLYLQNTFQQSIEPIRINRQYERKTRVKFRRGKYRTLTNYKRAV